MKKPTRISASWMLMACALALFSTQKTDRRGENPDAIRGLAMVRATPPHKAAPDGRVLKARPAVTKSSTALSR